jgi:UDP-N-acetylmuramoylalanine--D-glutamate ligase
VRELRGVRYVNDSKATNVAATLRALASFPGARRHVILGGRGKQEPYAPLADGLGPDDRAYLVGEAAEELARALAAAGRSYELAGDLERALASASRAARPGDVVLLSPACASFDQFRDFEHRGDEFRRLVEALT